MMRTRPLRRDTYEPPPETNLWHSCGGHRRRTSAAMWSIVFTGIQTWAVLAVLTLVRAQGVAQVALACVLGGAIMAVILAWQRCLPGRRRMPEEPDDQTDPLDPHGHATVRLRGHAD